MFGLSFSNPAMLHALWAAALPVVIHLLNRRRPVTVRFSDVRRLEALQQDRMRRVKLKQILLLIVRTLLIILIALSFAQPTFRGAQSVGAGGGQTAGALLLDRSMSMRHRSGDASLFERARKRLLASLDLFDPRDEIALFLVDDRKTALPSEDRERLKARVKATQPTFRGTDLRSGIEAASEYLVRSTRLNRELFIFTDLSRNGWAGFSDSLSGLQGTSVFVVTERPSNLNNVGIRGVAAAQILGPGDSGRLDVDLVNYSRSPRTGVPVDLFLGRRRIAQEVADLPGQGSERIRIRFSPEGSGAIPLRVETWEDDLTEDNTLTTILHLPGAVNVLLIGEAPEEMYYLEQALSAGSATQTGLSVRTIPPEVISETTLAGVDAILLCNVSSMARAPLGLLRRKVEGGAGLMVILGDRVDVRFYNDHLFPELFPASLVSISGRPGDSGRYESVQPSEWDHPLFRGLVERGTFVSPRFYAYCRLVLNGDARPLLAFPGGRPALAERALGKGRVLMFACSLRTDLIWTDLPLSGLFAPFVYRLARYLAVGRLGTTEYRVGESVEREAQSPPAKYAILRPPNGEARTIWPETRGGRAVWSLGEVEEPGLWEIYGDEDLIDRFAVQIPETEADLTPVSLSRLERLFPESRVRIVEKEEALADLVQATREGRALWRITLGGAFLLLCIELLMLRSEQRARR